MVDIPDGKFMRVVNWMSDLISRKDALMKARPEYLNPQQQKLASYNQGWNDAVDEYYDGIRALPSADRTARAAGESRKMSSGRRCL